MNKKNLNYYLLFLLILFSCFQNFSIINFEKFSFKISHMIAIVSIFPLLKLKKIKLPTVKILLFIMFVLVVSVFLYPIYGFNSLFFNYIFGLYYIILIINLGFGMSKETVLEMIQNVATIVMIATLIKILLNINIFISFFKNPANHPEIDCFFRWRSKSRSYMDFITWFFIL